MTFAPALNGNTKKRHGVLEHLLEEKNALESEWKKDAMSKILEEPEGLRPKCDYIHIASSTLKLHKKEKHLQATRYFPSPGNTPYLAHLQIQATALMPPLPLPTPRSPPARTRAHSRGIPSSSRIAPWTSRPHRLEGTPCHDGSPVMGSGRLDSGRAAPCMPRSCTQTVCTSTYRCVAHARFPGFVEIGEAKKVGRRKTKIISGHCGETHALCIRAVLVYNYTTHFMLNACLVRVVAYASGCPLVSNILSASRQNLITIIYRIEATSVHVLRTRATAKGHVSSRRSSCINKIAN